MNGRHFGSSLLTGTAESPLTLHFHNYCIYLCLLQLGKGVHSVVTNFQNISMLVLHIYMYISRIKKVQSGEIVSVSLLITSRQGTS